MAKLCIINLKLKIKEKDYIMADFLLYPVENEVKVAAARS